MMTSNSSRKIVDLRSDTLTKPTDEMRRSIANAEVGDDVFGEDPTVRKLEELAADMFGKDKGLFVPSGTMGNLISMMSHCWSRGSQVYLGDQSHIYNFEQGGISQIGNIIPWALPLRSDGTFDIADLVRKHRTGENYHNPKPEVVAVENPIDGKVLSLAYMKEVHDVAKQLNLKVHLDGARLGNAIVYLNCKPTDITKWVDSASICLSKGLGAPVGSVIVGSEDFIARARRMRKVLGGGMRQCGILAAAGIISLTKMVDRLQEDHDNARRFASGLQTIGPDIFELDMKDVQTNMVWIRLKDGVKCNENEITKMMAEPIKGNDTFVKVMSLAKRSMRAVFYNGITTSDVDEALEKLKLVCDAIRNKHI